MSALFVWPCQTRGCAERGDRVLTIEYGEPHEIETVAIRLCDEHLRGMREWLSDPSVVFTIEPTQ